LASTLIKTINWKNPELGAFHPTDSRESAPGAAIIFFSYIGFDATSTAAEESKDPAKDIALRHPDELLVCTVSTSCWPW
jgi:amino acid transporter